MPDFVQAMLKEIIDKSKSLNVFEQRCEKADYEELVFYNEQLQQWNKLITETLGPAIKPAGKRPSQEDLRLTKEHGSIFANQTLFKKETEEGILIAMLWPWQDNLHTTLKLAVLKK